MNTRKVRGSQADVLQEDERQSLDDSDENANQDRNNPLKTGGKAESFGNKRKI